MKIKAIIVDVAGILMTGSDGPMIRYCVSKYKIDKKTFEKYYFRYFVQFELGKISEEEYVQKLSKAIKRQLQKDFFRKKMTYNKLFTKNIEFFSKLKKKYSVYYLTNEGNPYWNNVMKKLNILKAAKGGWASCQIGHRKPSRAIFTVVLKKIGCKPREAVFIDDNPRNVRGAAKVGINVIQFKNLGQLKNELRRLGVDV